MNKNVRGFALVCVSLICVLVGGVEAAAPSCFIVKNKDRVRLDSFVSKLYEEARSGGYDRYINYLGILKYVEKHFFELWGPARHDYGVDAIKLMPETFLPLRFPDPNHIDINPEIFSSENCLHYVIRDENYRVVGGSEAKKFEKVLNDVINAYLKFVANKNYTYVNRPNSDYFYDYFAATKIYLKGDVTLDQIVRAIFDGEYTHEKATYLAAQAISDEICFTFSNRVHRVRGW